MTGTCWWCGRPATEALAAYLDGQLISVDLCPECRERTRTLIRRGTVDALDLRDALAVEGEPEPVPMTTDLGLDL